jgi:hypothetical protein
VKEANKDRLCENSEELESEEEGPLPGSSEW